MSSYEFHYNVLWLSKERGIQGAAPAEQVLLLLQYHEPVKDVGPDRRGEGCYASHKTL